MPENLTNSAGIPIGFGMALAQNLPAMQRFASLPPERQQRIIVGTHGIHSQEAMQAYVRSLRP